MSSNLIYSPSAARVLNSIPSNEHTAGDRTPYCYLIGWTEHNIWYYGRRTAVECHPSEFWKKYKTSSNYVAEFVDLYGDPDHIEIRHIFTSIERCVVWESRVLTTIDAASRIDFLNKTNGDDVFHSTNNISVLDTFTGKKEFISCDLYHTNKHRYVFHTKGMVVVYDVDGKSKSVTTEEYQANKSIYKTNASDTVTLKDYQGNTVHVNISDKHKHPELITASTREHWYVDVNTETTFKMLPNNPITNQHGVYRLPKKRFVYKDKSGQFYYEYANSDFVATRYYDQLVPILTDLVIVYTIDNKQLKTHISDPRIRNGEYRIKEVVRESRRGYIPAKTSSGEVLYVKTSDPRLNSGELRRTLDGYVAVKDKDGNRFSVDASDPRLKSGELVGSNKDTSPYQHIVTGKISMLTQDDPRISDGTHVKFDVVAYRETLKQRPEVQELLQIAKEKNLKIRMSWTYAKDISKARDYILNSPPNSSQYEKVKSNL